MLCPQILCCLWISNVTSDQTISNVVYFVSRLDTKYVLIFVYLNFWFGFCIHLYIFKFACNKINSLLHILNLNLKHCIKKENQMSSLNEIFEFDTELTFQLTRTQMFIYNIWQIFDCNFRLYFMILVNNENILKIRMILYYFETPINYMCSKQYHIKRQEYILSLPIRISVNWILKLKKCPHFMLVKKVLLMPLH